jgi:uncharacterized membrane protein
MIEGSKLPANWEPRGAPEPAKSKKRPPYLPIAIVVVVAAMLTVGSFLGCASTVGNKNSGLVGFFFYSFFVCAAITILSVVALVVVFVVDGIRNRNEI